MGKYCCYILVSIILIGCGTQSGSIDKYVEERQRLTQLLDVSVRSIDQELFDKATLYLDSAKILALDINDSLSLSSVLNNYGQVFQKQGKFQEGLFYYQQALEIDQNLADSSRIGRRLKNIGICYRQLGLYETSLDYNLRSLTIAKGLNDSMEVASVNNSIGNLHNILENYDLAYGHFSTALAIWEQLKDERRSSIAKNNLGNSLLGQDSVKQAIVMYQEVLIQKEKVGNQSSLAITLNNLGEAYLRSGEFSDAKEVLDRAYSIRTSLNENKRTAIVLNNLAKLAFEQNNFQSAKTYISWSLGHLEGLPPSEVALNALDILKSILEREGELSRAMSIDDQIDQLQEQLFRDEKLLVVNRLNAYERNLLESEKEEAERESLLQEQLNDQQRLVIIIVLFGLLIAIILGIVIFRGRERERQQNSVLDKKNKELDQKNEVIASINQQNFHFVKNALTEVVSMLHLQTHRLEEGQVKETLMAEKLRLESVNILYRQLFDAPEQAYMELKPFLEQVINNTLEGCLGYNHGVNFQNKITPVQFTKSKTLSLGLIVNEVCFNACKYALKAGGIFEAFTQLSESSLHLILRDTGDGLPTGPAFKASFGMKLIRSLCADLEAKMEIESKANGLTYHFHIPLLV